MSTGARVVKLELEISDMDRHYYASHTLTLAQQASETDERVMARVVAFALFADPALEFGRGSAVDDEADLWRRSLSGEVEQWIMLGQPDEARVRRACGRAREVLVVGYSGRAFALWWEKNRAALARCDNLRVLSLPADVGTERLYARSMRLQCLIQDGELQLMSASDSLSLTPEWLEARR